MILEEVNINFTFSDDALGTERKRMNKTQSITGNEITWTRMNLKEVVSEHPCPLTQSILIDTLKLMFITEYKKMGYNLPEEIELVRVFYGRPYFNTNILLKIVLDFFQVALL